MRIGVGLSIPELSTRGGRFSPASLFTGGVQGAWYAPDDFSTLFQDSVGTTPVTAVEQPVGLMLDKSQGLVLGSELVTDGTLWTAVAPTTSSWNSGTSTVRVTGGASGGSYYNFASVAGVFYKLTFTVSVVTAGTWYMIGKAASNGGGSNNIVNTDTVGKTVTCYFAATSTASSLYIQITSGGVIDVSGITLKALAGNHALQATSASRPVLRARYNLLTYSEQFDNAAWSILALNAFGSGSVANTTVTTDPLSGNTADYIQESTATNIHASYRAVTSDAATYTLSVYAKKAQRSWLSIRSAGSSGNGRANFDLENGVVGNVAADCTAAIQAIGNGWYRCSTTGTWATSGSKTYYIGIIDSNRSTASDPSYTGDGTSGIYIWGADLRTGSSAGTYQRIAAATDYATAGFLPYLDLITDDSFGTNSIDFTATDEMSVCVGVTKLSDAALAFISELSANVNTNNGSFYLLAPSSAGGNDFTFSSKGTASTPFISVASASPVTNVITAQSKISTPLASIRKNGAASGSSSATQGTGNYGNYPLYIGRRNNTSSPFNGRIYQLIVCGKTLSAAELASTESFVATKTGVVI